MELKYNNTKFIVVNMIMADSSDTPNIKYNVFTEDYKHITTIDAKNELEFGNKFNNFLISQGI